MGARETCSNSLICRYLVLRKTDLCFLALAPSTLRILVYEHKTHTGEDLSLHRITELTSLKRLELIGGHFVDRHYGPSLGGLGLQELVLIDCPEAELFLFTDVTSYSTLASLHIEENEEEAMLPIPPSLCAREEMSRYIKSMEVATNLRSIRRVSGSSRFLRHYMKMSPYRWCKSFAPGPEISEFSRFSDEGMTFRVWTKPENLQYQD